MKKSYLSKSRFLKGLQCHKALWLHSYKPELRAEPDALLLAKFEAGKEVGKLAQGLFPGGEEIVYEAGSLNDKLQKTHDLIRNGVQTIYEATFSFENVLVMVDILKRGREGWEIYEAKSTTEMKEVHLDDVAIQYYVLNGSGLTVSKASLVSINNQYVRKGALDIDELFCITDLTEEVKAHQGLVNDELRKMNRMLAGICPDIDIGMHCSDPYECDFKAHCWAHVPEYSIFDIKGLYNSHKFDLYYKGVLQLSDIPEDYSLNAGQSLQIEAELTGGETIDKERIRAFLDILFYPLFFLDFETFMVAVPPFDGTRPYQQIPYQYSLHFFESENAELKHCEFLAQAGFDQREALIKNLTSAIPDNACILSYNMSFEKRVLRELADQFGEHADKLMIIHNNVLDLMLPFQKKYYYTKEMKGSYSLKYVLPALVSELSYEGMRIKSGDEAMLAYLSLPTIEDEDTAVQVKNDLLEYCKIDTLGMVKLLEKLKETVTSN